MDAHNYTRDDIRKHIAAIRQMRQDMAYSTGGVKLAAHMAHPYAMQRLTVELAAGARHRKERIGYRA